MGGEGAQWIGQAPFTDVDHTFQNVGDGTFFHSGQLAVQACVAAGVNITYKILLNSAVAMTGAQEARPDSRVPELTHKLTARACAGSSSVPTNRTATRAPSLADGAVVWHRDASTKPSAILRDVPGRDRPDLRPAVRGGGRQQAQARHAAGSSHPRDHQRSRLRRLRRLRRQEQLPVRAAGAHRVRPQDADRPDHLQHRLHLPRR